MLLTSCYTTKEDTVLNSVQIGHSYLTYSFLKKEKEPPVCIACDTIITIKQIFKEYAYLVEVRKKYCEERSLYSLFQNVNPEKNFDYLKEICMLYKA